MPIAPQVPNDPIDVGETGFEEEESDVVYVVDSDDLEPVVSQLDIVTADLAAASAEADAAFAAATAATATANGKNRVTFSTSAPSGTYTNIAVGDLWFQRNGSGILIGTFEWNGSSWVSRQFGDATLDSLTANKITAGQINLGLGVTVVSGLGTRRVQLDSNGLRLFDDSGNAAVYLNAGDGSATFRGTVTSGSTVTGATINSAVAVNSDGLVQAPFFFIKDNGSLTGGSNTSLTLDTVVVGSSGSGTNGLLRVNGFTRPRYYDWSTGVTELNRGWTDNCHPYQDGASVDLPLGFSGRRWTRLWATTTTISTSDQRLKTDIQDTPLGLDFIKSIRPVAYRWIKGGGDIVRDDEGNPTFDDEGNPVVVTRPGRRLHYGFIAQEVKQALDAAGVEDFAGWVQDDLSDPESTQSLSYEQFIAPLTKAVQQLSDQVEALQARITELENKP